MLLRPALRSCLLAILVAQVAASNFRRQSGAPSGGDPDPTPSDDTDTPPPTSSTVTPSSTSSTPSSTSSPTSTPSPTSTTEPSTNPASNTTPPPETTPNTPPPTETSDLPPIIVDGSEHISFETVTNTKSSSSVSATPTNTKDDKKDDDDGIGTGPIVGMSVAGGLAVLGIIAFFVWKFTRKRFSTFDDSEPIKWPELNSHGGAADSHPLPVRDTGRAGFGDTGSESDLSRVNTNNYSTSDFSGSAHDPYAVPPLPHLNPNQPYRDDPTSAAGYYDPYRGPVPATVENGQGWEGESIPMNQIHHGGAAGYEQQQLYGGRQSPGPLQAYDAGRGSPAPPNMGYQQPVAYDGAGRQSPGPMAAYGARGPSPGPTAAYGAAPGYAQQPPGYR